MPSLTISIPSYNDGPMIEDLVRRSRDVLARLVDEGRILLIDDGSSDNTAEVCRRLAQLPNVTFHSHPVNLGFGPTIRESYLLPQTDWAVFLPGDGQVPPETVVDLFRHHEGHDVVLGIRRVRRDRWNRRFVSRCYNTLVSLAAGQRIHDVSSTALVRRSILEGVTLKANSGFVHAEIVLLAVRHGARLIQVPIDHQPRVHGVGAGNRPSVIWSTFVELLQYVLFRRRSG